MLTMKALSKMFSTSNHRDNLIKKVSPAALWHANALGIDLNEIVGSGPKGHILKSDILSFKPKIEVKSNTLIDISFHFEIPPTTELLIQICINRITSLDKISQVQYKFVPEIGFLQLSMKGEEVDRERIMKLMNIYLNDTRHLLL